MPKRTALSKKSTLQDVAAKAGVSKATVSRVLNNSALVTPETRDRVGAAMEALRFAPSAAARSLNIGKTRTIGTLVPTIDHSIFARYLRALEDALSDRGHGLVVAVTGGDAEVEAKKAQDLLSLGVDGLIVSGVARSPSFHALAERFEVPVLITSYFAPDARYPTVGYDNAAVAGMAMEYLRGKGHCRVAVIHGPLADSDRTAARVSGARAAAKGIEARFFETALNVPGGAKAMAEVLATEWGDPAGPSVALCLSDVQALGAMFEAQRAGLGIPEGISIMGFDNLDWSAVSEPGLTSIALPADQMGEVAAIRLVDHLVSGLPMQPMELPARIVERGSVADLGSA